MCLCDVFVICCVMLYGLLFIVFCVCVHVFVFSMFVCFV